jgi:predicted tellurium resistance membrane protein TerC
LELFTAPWWSALLAIILIDLVLAGDNAIVIALAARNLPPHLQKKAIAWGTVGAIVVRSAMTVGVVWLLKVPGPDADRRPRSAVDRLQAPGRPGQQRPRWPHCQHFLGRDENHRRRRCLMGVDNVLGVAGAAHGSFDLVVIGLLVSIPIVVFGSTMVLKLVERFPIIINLGAAVLAFTAAKMIVSEQLLDPIYGGPSALTSETLQTVAQWATYAVAVAGVLGGGWLATRRSKSSSNNADLIPH